MVVILTSDNIQRAEQSHASERWQDYLDEDGFDTMKSYKMRNQVTPKRLEQIRRLYGEERAKMIEENGYDPIF